MNDEIQKQIEEYANAYSRNLSNACDNLAAVHDGNLPGIDSWAAVLHFEAVMKEAVEDMSPKKY